MKKYFILWVLAMLLACDGIDEAHETSKVTFDVTVVGVESCNFVLIEFREEDLQSVRKITGEEGLRYHALNLNKILVHPGQKLSVEIRKMNDDEWVACPTFAPTYPGIVLLSLKFEL
jgi:hypothetical protein